MAPPAKLQELLVPHEAFGLYRRVDRVPGEVLHIPQPQASGGRRGRRWGVAGPADLEEDRPAGQDLRFPRKDL